MRTATYSAEQMQRTARYYTAKAMVIDTGHGEPRIETISARVFALNKELALKELKRTWPEAAISELQGHIAKFVMEDEAYFTNSVETETVEVEEEEQAND